MKQPFIYLLLALLFASCATRRQATVTMLQPEPLTEAEARRHDYYYLEATRLRQQGKIAEAMAFYEHCLSINPHSAAAMYELAQFYSYLQQPDKAGSLLEQAVALQPDNFWYRQMLGDFYRSTNQPDKAIALYEEMEQRFPGNGTVQMMLLNLYNQQRDHLNVIRILDSIEQKEGKSEQLSMEKVRLYMQSGQREKAFAEIEALAAEHPHDTRYRVMLGDSYMDNGHPEKALEIYNQVLEGEPDNPLAQLSLTSYYERTGQDSLYRLQQERILTNPKLGNEARVEVMRRIVVESEQKQQDSTRIISLFNRLMQMPQEDISIPLLYLSYMQHKKMDEHLAIPVLDKILEVEPDNVMASYTLLKMAFDENDYEWVRRICEPAIQYTPGELPFYYYLGIVYFQKKENGKALEVLTQGVRQAAPESDKKLLSDTYTFIGDLYHAMDRQTDCYAAYDSALVHNPNNVGVLNNYAYFLSLDKRDLDRAEEMSYRAIKAEPENDTYLDTYAWILFEKERYTEARIYIDQAMKNGGTASATIIEHCGDIYYMLGLKEEAMAYWRQAAAMEHDSRTLEKKIRLGRYVDKW